MSSTMSSRLRAAALIVGFGAALAGCAGDQDELTQWMEQQKREVKPNVEPLSPPKKFIPQPYAASWTISR